MSKTNFQDGIVFDFYKPHKSPGMSDWGPSLTKQEFAPECDINEIMRRYESGDRSMFQMTNPPEYLDLTRAPSDLMEAMNTLNAAQVAFMSLPAAVRREFENDPHQFVDFASDPDNLPQMRTWGLAPPEKPAEKPLEVRVIPDAPAVPPAPEPPKGG